MYTLRVLEDSDIPMVEAWLKKDYVAKWFGDLSDWMDEINGRFGEYSFIHHFIAEMDGKPIGFCQYFDYGKLPVEEDGQAEPVGTYGIDYMLGDETLLGQGIGKILVQLISDKVLQESNMVSQLVADPTIEEQKTNIASIKVLEANGFSYDAKSELYKKQIQ